MQNRFNFFYFGPGHKGTRQIGEVFSSSSLCRRPTTQNKTEICKITKEDQFMTEKVNDDEQGSVELAM